MSTCFSHTFALHIFFTKIMAPTTRSVRQSTQPQPAFIDDDDEEFGTTQPFILDDLYTPEEKEKKKPPAAKKQTKKKVCCSAITIETSPYECDKNLPGKGLDLEAKMFLLNHLTMKGGTGASNYQSRFLHKLCNEHPDLLGCQHSLRRKRVKWLVDRWKRDKDFDNTRAQLMIAAAAPPTPLPPQPSLVPPPEIKRTSATPAPPPVKKEIKTMSNTLGSPLRMLRGTGGRKRKSIFSLLHCFLCLASAPLAHTCFSSSPC